MTSVPERDLPVALHRQISDRLRANIASGAWPAHFRLAPEPELATELRVSRGTLRRALSTLVREGLLVQIKGRGTFVTPTTIEPAIAQSLSTLSEDLAAQRVGWATTVLGARVHVPAGPVSALLGLPPDQAVFEVTRVRTGERGAFAYLVNSVRTDVAPGIEALDFSVRSLFDVLEGDYGLAIGTGRRTFDAVAAPPEVARHLAVDTGAPLLHLEQITYLADGRALEYSDVWIDSTLVKVTSILSR